MREPVWEFLIVNYLFLGGLSAGLFFVSALAGWFQVEGRPAHPRLARWGALLAPWPVSLGSALLIFDLGQPLRFWKLFLHFRWQSPMSIGSWLLVAFTLLCLVYLWAWLEASERQWLRSWIPKKVSGRLPAWIRTPLEADPTALRRELILPGIPIAIGVGIYTGVLLGAVQARPFWNTNLVAQMFLFSALSTGTAALLLVRLFDKEVPMEARELRFLYGLDIALILLEFFIVLPYVIHGQLSVEAVQTALKLILGGPYTFAFWGLFLGLGLLVPLAMELWEFRPVWTGKGTLHVARAWGVSAAGLVLLGGYVLRYIFVFAGQASGFR